jgi:hypothetical protein
MLSRHFTGTVSFLGQGVAARPLSCVAKITTSMLVEKWRPVIALERTQRVNRVPSSHGLYHRKLRWNMPPNKKNVRAFVFSAVREFWAVGGISIFLYQAAKRRRVGAILHDTVGGP